MAAAIDFAPSVDLVDPLCKLSTINDAQGQMAIEEGFKSTQDKWMKWVVQMRNLHEHSEWDVPTSIQSVEAVVLDTLVP